MLKWSKTWKRTTVFNRLKWHGQYLSWNTAFSQIHSAYIIGSLLNLKIAGVCMNICSRFVSICLFVSGCIHSTARCLAMGDTEQHLLRHIHLQQGPRIGNCYLGSGTKLLWKSSKSKEFAFFFWFAQ